MAYRVKIMPRVRRDLAGIFGWVEAESSEAALTWYVGLKDAIRSLCKNSGLSPVVPGNKDLRYLLYGRKPHVFRIIYRIMEKQKQVEVLHFRHGARAEFNR